MGPLDLRDLLHQGLLLGRNGEQLPKGALGLLHPLPSGDLPKELGGTDAGEGPPGGGHRIEGLHDLIDAQLQRPLLLPFHIQDIRSRLDRHDPFDVLRHGQAFSFVPQKDHEEPELRFGRIGKDGRLSQKQADLLGHIVIKPFGVGDQLNHG